MYPVQNYPVYPNQLQYPNPYMQPQVNAVKIDINNPQAYGGVNSHGQINPMAPAPQVMPANYAPVYGSIPTVSQYSPQVAYPQPWFGPMMPQPQQTTATATATAQAPAPVQQPAPAPAPVVVPPVVVQQPTVAPAPVQPVVVTPPTTTTTTSTAQTTTTAPQVSTAFQPAPVPVVPAPVPVVAGPVTQTVNVNPPAAVVDSANTPAAQATATATATATANPAVAQTPVQPVAPVEVKPELEPEVNKILADLASANPDAQTAAQQMAEIAQTNPTAAKAFLNEQTFGQLVNVINADTSKLQGPVEGQDPNVLSPLEKAEINKQFAVYTLAILQKNFRDEINKEMQKNNYPDIAINDLPYIKEGIVNNLKDNPNPTIREACLSALNYVGRPEDKEVLRVLYDISAKHDASPDVKAVAAEYLSKLPA